MLGKIALVGLQNMCSFFLFDCFLKTLGAAWGRTPPPMGAKVISKFAYFGISVFRNKNNNFLLHRMFTRQLQGHCGTLHFILVMLSA
jgi:hypothetical protein